MTTKDGPGGSVKAPEPSRGQPSLEGPPQIIGHEPPRFLDVVGYVLLLMAGLAALVAILLALLPLRVSGEEWVTDDPFGDGMVVRDNAGRATERIRQDPFDDDALVVEDYDTGRRLRKVEPDPFGPGYDALGPQEGE